MSLVLAPQVAVPANNDTRLLASVDPKEFARELLNTKQYKCFAQLMGKESAWNSNAQNPHSTAKGIGQLLDGTYKALGFKHSELPAAQVVAALAYIGRKYGSAGPCGAWQFFQSKNYY